MGWIGAVGARGAVVAPPPPPGGGETFGPIEGRTSVINNAKPRAVTDPGGGITFSTQSDLETKINANPSGTKFVHAAGGTVNWTSNLNVGTKAPKIYFLGLAGSTATVIDGGGLLNVVGLSGTNGTGGAAGTGFEIHGGRWTNFGGSADNGNGNPINMQDGSLLEDCQFDGNWNSGFKCSASNGRVRYVKTSDNGRDGWTLSEYTTDGPIREGNIFERIETSGNNTRQLSPGGHAGGAKMLQCRNIITRLCYTHDNLGFGLWYDLNADIGGSLTNNTFEDCVAENNARCGLFYEQGFSGPLITHNYLKNNGNDLTIGPQAPSYGSCTAMRITNTDCSVGGTGRGEISFNYFDYDLPQDGDLGGLLVLWNHDQFPGGKMMQNWDVHDNQFWLRSAVTQSNRRVTMQDSATSGTPVMGNADINFNRNEYHVASMATEYWQECDPGTRTEDGLTWSEWVAAGRDTDGQRTQI